MPELQGNICPFFMAASKIIRELIRARDADLGYLPEADIGCIKGSCAVWDEHTEACSLKRAYRASPESQISGEVASNKAEEEKGG